MVRMNTPHHTKEYPCDLIIDRYLPDASPEERDKAREDLNNFAQALLRIATRRALEERSQAYNGGWNR